MHTCRCSLHAATVPKPVGTAPNNHKPRIIHARGAAHNTRSFMHTCMCSLHAAMVPTVSSPSDIASTTGPTVTQRVTAPEPLLPVLPIFQSPAAAEQPAPVVSSASSWDLRMRSFPDGASSNLNRAIVDASSGEAPLHPAPRPSSELWWVPLALT